MARMDGDDEGEDGWAMVQREDEEVGDKVVCGGGGGVV